MKSEESGGSSSGDWSLVGGDFKNSDENQSDIEVISNPPSEPEPVVFMEPEQEQTPRTLLYSEVLQKPPALESDIEFVPEPLTPELEFDDEEYLNEVLRSAKISSDSESAASSESESEDEECCFPANIHEMRSAMTEEEVEAKEVVLEVNLTLLSFTIIVGVSGMSGFLLGGIYSAVLTNNISHSTDLAEYPGSLPSFLYSDAETCPSSDSGCESRLYRVEENMKHLKDTLSHDIRNCHDKLKTTIRQNAALHKTNRETAEYSSKKCANSKAKLEKLKSESAKLNAKLGKQRAAYKEYKHQANSEAARNALQIATLAQSLENSKTDLANAKQAISVLDGLNTECRKKSILSSLASETAVGVAKRQSDESSGYWKNLYQHTVKDLDQAERRVKDLEKNLKKELENLKESQVAESNAKINYLKERNSKQYFKNMVKKYTDMLETMERKYIKAKSRQQQLGQEFENLKSLSSKMELNLESCSNATVRAEKRAKNAVKSKQYIETMLINRISDDKQEYRTLKEMYVNQKNIISEMESQRSTLEESLIRKISANRKKFLSAKSNLENTLAAYGANKRDSSSKYNTLKNKIGKSRGAKLLVKEQLEQSKVVIAEYQEQMELFKNYVQKIEASLLKLREDVIMREAIQREYIASVSRQHEKEVASLHAHYKSLLSNTDAFEKLKKKHDKMLRELREEEGSKKYWKDAAQFQKHQADTLKEELDGCKNGKVTAISEYRKTTEMLLELIQGVASRPKCDLDASPLFYDQPSYSPLPPKSFTPHAEPPLFPVSIVSEELGFTPVVKKMKNSTGKDLMLLKQLYNSTLNSESELETCYSTISPLFPGIPPQTLADVINMTQSRDHKVSGKMSSALTKHWGGVDKTYNKLFKKRLRSDDDDDDDDDDEDWYFKRFRSSGEREVYPKGPSRSEGKAYYSRLGKADSDWYMSGKNRKGEGQYSYVNKQKTNLSHGRHKGGFNCELFDCRRPYSAHMEFAFELCGC